MSLFRLPTAALALSLLAGCMAMPARDDGEWAPTPPMQPEVAAAPADGAIYHDNQNMELFSDARAHRVGDILTIVLVESTQAS
ncbi:flagellar basal body L-ring protein FlgH, partial [Demequina sp. EGI L300058]